VLVLFQVEPSLTNCPIRGDHLYVTGGAVGVSALVMASTEAFTMVKILGAAYLVWLGLKAWREARVLLPTDVRMTGSRHAFREGVIVEALNPKTAAFFLAFIPQFVDASQPIAAQFVVLGLISVALNTAADIVVTYWAAMARTGLENCPSLIVGARQASGAIMCGLGASLLFARRST
jgi:threonine/homoserine/homoserine lactone efflux protein